MKNIQLTAGENSNHTTTQNKASSAGIGVSFSPQGLSGLSLHASKAQGNSRENALTYTPTEIAAKDALQIESGKDTNILGSTVQGDKVMAKIGGNLNIETLQEKETYEEKNTSAGFDLSWDINLGKFSKPTIGLSASEERLTPTTAVPEVKPASLPAKAALISMSRRTPPSRAQSLQARQLRERIASAQGRSLSATWRTRRITTQRASVRSITTTAAMTR